MPTENSEEPKHLSSFHPHVENRMLKMYERVNAGAAESRNKA